MFELIDIGAADVPIDPPVDIIDTSLAVIGVAVPVVEMFPAELK
jgi:hypothetical protein